MGMNDQTSGLRPWSGFSETFISNRVRDRQAVFFAGQFIVSGYFSSVVFPSAYMFVYKFSSRTFPSPVSLSPIYFAPVELLTRLAQLSLARGSARFGTGGLARSLARRSSKFGSTRVSDRLGLGARFVTRLDFVRSSDWQLGSGIGSFFYSHLSFSGLEALHRFMAPLKARLGARDSARLCSDKARLVLTELRERNTDRALGLCQAGGPAQLYSRLESQIGSKRGSARYLTWLESGVWLESLSWRGVCCWF